MSSTSNTLPANADTATRLLTWINRVQPDMAIEEMASQIADGLCEIAGCHHVVVVVRELPGDDLVLLAESNVEPSATGDDTPPPRLAASHLAAVLPEAAFVVAEAPWHLQDFIGEVSAFVRDNTRRPASRVQPAGSAPLLALPLRSLNVGGVAEVIGLALLWSHDQAAAVDTVLPLLQTVAAQAGGCLSAALRTERLGLSYQMLAGVFADAIDHRNFGQSEPSRAVSYYAGLIARALALPPVHVARIELAGLLHHVGKLTVPDAILHKDVPLTVAERELVRTAIVAGADWLNSVEGLQEVADMVRHQGENYDGSGYPDQLVGVEIPVGARVLAVARRFTAMTSRRTERPPLSVVGGALESVTEESGSTFDPRVVNAFLAALGRTV